MPVRVRVKKMISARIILVHTFFYETHPEHAGVKIEVLLCGSRDRGDVMKSPDGLHCRTRNDLVTYSKSGRFSRVRFCACAFRQASIST